MKYGNKIKEILEVNSDNFLLKLKYKNNRIYLIDLSKLFEKPHSLAAEILRGQLFDKCFIENGALAWPNGLELCPDALLLKYGVDKKKRAA